MARLKPEWRCAAPHCRGKSRLPMGLRLTYDCPTCGNRYHAGCSGGTDSESCDECHATLTRRGYTPAPPSRRADERR
jgi:ribosomal protein L37AE/L43A